MARKTHLHSRPAAPKSPADDNGAGTPSTELASVIGRVKTLLQEQRPQEALDFVNRRKQASPWISNARGVCMLRLESTDEAIAVFRGLAAQSGIVLKPDAPVIFKTNFATALLASGNLAGCLSVLHETNAEDAPTVRQLRDSIERWRRSLSWWQRLHWLLGDFPSGRVSLDFPLGELE